MNRNRCALLFALSVCLAAGGAVYAIGVTETTDFPGGFSFNPGVSVGTLDPGANTVSGSLAGNCVLNTNFNFIDCNPGTVAGGDTQDSFNITVPAGYQITSLTVGTSNVSGPASFSATMSLERNASPSPPVNVIPTTFLALGGTTANLVTSPIGAGEYAVSVFGQSASTTGAFSLNWTVTVNLAPVVASPADAVRNLINLIGDPLSGLVLTTGQINSLTDKLNNALTSIQTGQYKQAINQLQSFIASLQTSLKTGKIDAQTAATLTVAANAIITSLQQ